MWEAERGVLELQGGACKYIKLSTHVNTCADTCMHTDTPAYNTPSCRCLYAHTCTHICTHTHTQMYKYIQPVYVPHPYTSPYLCTHLHIPTYLHTFQHMPAHACTTSKPTFLHTSIHTLEYTSPHLYIHLHTPVHITPTPLYTTTHI